MMATGRPVSASPGSGFAGPRTGSAAGDGEDAGPQDVGHGMGDPVWITRIADHRGKLVGQSEAPLGRGQHHDAAVRCDAPAVEPGGDLLASNGWK
jgi:hypothetical protein